jgi:ABC-type spermidine/putrescine transport system permease subunit I
MKTPIAVTLIIMGALLVLTPALADFFYQRNVVELLAKSGVTGVTLAGQMSQVYRFGCWLTGSGMITVAVALSCFRRSQTEARPGLAPQAA